MPDVYRLDKQTPTMEKAFDFPSQGDTAFPGLVEIDTKRYLMYNYSNDPEGKDQVWMRGPLGKTNLDSTIMTIESKEGMVWRLRPDEFFAHRIWRDWWISTIRRSA